MVYSLETEKLNKLNNNMFVLSVNDEEQDYFQYLINKYNLVNKIDYLNVV